MHVLQYKACLKGTHVFTFMNAIKPKGIPIPNILITIQFYGEWNSLCFEGWEKSINVSTPSAFHILYPDNPILFILNIKQQICEVIKQRFAPGHKHWMTNKGLSILVLLCIQFFLLVSFKWKLLVSGTL